MKALWCVLMFVAGSSVAMADATPVVDQRQDNQDARIEQGQASGELTNREASRLDAGQEHVENMEDRAKADGNVTARERARLHRAENRNSRRIYKQKHDRQDKD